MGLVSDTMEWVLSVFVNMSSQHQRSHLFTLSCIVFVVVNGNGETALGSLLAAHQHQRSLGLG